MTEPPHTLMACPVIYAAPSEAKNATTSATSSRSSSAQRISEQPDAGSRPRVSSRHTRHPAADKVVEPLRVHTARQTALTVIPAGASSMARHCVKPPSRTSKSSTPRDS